MAIIVRTHFKSFVRNGLAMTFEVCKYVILKYELT